MRKIIISILLLSLFFAYDAIAGGIQGRAAIKGEVVEGVKIYAYKDFATGLKEEPFKISGPTKLDGTYKLDLPAGVYYFVARKTEGGIELKEGDMFCYYSGSPIEVTGNVYKNVGFNLIKVAAGIEDKKGEQSGVIGDITFEGKKLEKVYLFAYKNASSDFKGPADYVFPSVNGRFKLRLPEGEYYLIARKRKMGGMYGPIEKEDYFNYYYGNPVKVEKNVFKGISIECITRLDLLETPIEETDTRGLSVLLKDETGAPLKGLYLLVYTDVKMKGRPEYVSERSDEKGGIFIELNKPGKYYLIAREKLGGPAGEGEYYSKYSAEDSSVVLEPDDMHKNIDFIVKKYEKENNIEGEKNE